MNGARSLDILQQNVMWQNKVGCEEQRGGWGEATGSWSGNQNKNQINSKVYVNFDLLCWKQGCP